MNVGDKVQGIKGDVQNKKGTVLSIVPRKGLRGSSDRVWLTVKSLEGYTFSGPEDAFKLLF